MIDKEIKKPLQAKNIALSPKNPKSPNLLNTSQAFFKTHF